MDYLVREMVEHYHTERPHQSKDNQPLLLSPSPDAAVSEPAGTTSGPVRQRPKTRSSAINASVGCSSTTTIAGGVSARCDWRRSHRDDT